MSLKLIVALDFAKKKDALLLVDQLDPEQCALKVGLEMFTLFGASFVRELNQKKFKVFLDLKFHDIPNTVAQACRACAELEVWMINVHASGGLAMMQAARKAIEPYGPSRPLLIAVTLLTSLGQSDLAPIGLGATIEDQVNTLAHLSNEAQLDGVVCSAYEVPLIKKLTTPSFLTITPGIRLPNDSKDDQTRIVSPSQAIKLGADFLVIGRTITKAPSPAQVVKDILLSLD